MYEKELVSIIVPCYNGEYYVERFFDSLLIQTYKRIELIIVNDGSTDQSEKLILEYKEKMEPLGMKFRYIKQENGGLGSAIHTGLLAVQGEYFVWFNIDDILTKQAIEKMVSFLGDKKEYGLVRPNVFMSTEDEPFNAKYLINDGNPDKSKENLFENALYQRNFTFGCSMLRTEWFDEINPERYMYESRQGQNWQLLLPMFYHYKSGYIDEPLYYVVVQENSTSNVHTYQKKIEQIAEYEKILLKTLDSMNIPEKQSLMENVQIVYAHRMFRWAIGNDDFKIAKQMYKKVKKMDRVTMEEKKKYRRRFLRIEYWIMVKRNLGDRVKI